MCAALNGDEGERKRKWERMSERGKERERERERRRGKELRPVPARRVSERGRGAGTLTLDNPPLRARPRPLFHGIASELRAN